MKCIFKMNQDSELKSTPCDQREKHSPSNKLSDDSTQLIKNHILSYHLTVSHYRREYAPNRCYLPPELSIKTLPHTIHDYTKNCLLYVIHKCQRGFDHTTKEELFARTSKSAEGHSTEEAFVQAKEEGMQKEVHWQDADSPSAKAIQEIMPETKIMKCFGHWAGPTKNQMKYMFGTYKQ